MADSIKDKKANYIRVKDILSSKYEEVDGYEFYKYIFPNNQRVGELAEDYWITEANTSKFLANLIPNKWPIVIPKQFMEHFNNPLTSISRLS